MASYYEQPKTMRYHTTHSRGFSKALSELMRLRNFHLRRETAAAVAERRALQAQIRFESQKQKGELHAARMEALRLKQEALNSEIRRRKGHSPSPPLPKSLSPTPPNAPNYAMAYRVHGEHLA